MSNEGSRMDTSCVFISDAARIIGVSTQTLRAWEKTGRMVPQRIAGVRIFPRAECERIGRERHERAQIAATCDGDAR